MTVDVIVGMSLMGAAGMILRIVNRGGSVGRFVTFGAILGFGYLSKVVMLSMSVMFFVAILLVVKLTAANLRNWILAVLVFTAINAPHVMYLSKQKGRVDLGDTGRLAYAWLVNQVSPLFHWTGDDPRFGIAAHPPRRVIPDPEVFDYSGYAFGTYPPGYDPS